MKFKKIVYYGIKSAPDAHFQERLKQYCEELKVVLAEKDFDSTLKPEDLEDAEVLVSYMFNNFNENVFSKANKLKLIVQMSTDTSFYDKKFLKTKNIVLTDVGHYSTEAVTEATIAALFCIARKTCEAIQFVRQGNWGFEGWQGWQLKDKTLGIIGAGHIGSRVAEIGKNIGMKTIYYSRTRKKDLEDQEIEYKNLDELIKESDIISLHLALTSETEKILNKKRLELMKPGAVLLNTARSELCDMGAVYELCKKGKITAYFDSIEEKEMRDKMASLENVYITPHYGWMTKEAQQNLRDEAIKNIQAFLEGNLRNIAI